MSKENKLIICISFCAVISCAAVYLSLPGAGIISSFPLLALCGFAVVYFPGSLWVKLLMMPLVGFLLASVKLADTLHSAYIALLCLVMVLAAYLFKYLLKRKKALFIAAAVVTAAASVLINTAFCGFFADSIKANEIISEYSANRFGSTNVISGVYFDHTNGIYKADIYSKSEPTVIRSVKCVSGRATDNLTPAIEKLLMEKNTLSITAMLREAFPDAGFTITADAIAGYPSAKVDASDTTDYTDRMCFTIHIKSSMTRAEFASAAQSFADTLCVKNAAYGKITFVGGSGFVDLFCVTVRKGHFLTRVSADRVTPVQTLPFVNN